MRLTAKIGVKPLASSSESRGFVDVVMVSAGVRPFGRVRVRHEENHQREREQIRERSGRGAWPRCFPSGRTMDLRRDADHRALF